MPEVPAMPEVSEVPDMADVILTFLVMQGIV